MLTLGKLDKGFTESLYVTTVYESTINSIKISIKKTEHVFIRVPTWNDISIKDIHVNMKDIRKNKLNIFKTP